MTIQYLSGFSHGSSSSVIPSRFLLQEGNVPDKLSAERHPNDHLIPGFSRFMAAALCLLRCTGISSTFSSVLLGYYILNHI